MSLIEHETSFLSPELMEAEIPVRMEAIFRIRNSDGKSILLLKEPPHGTGHFSIVPFRADYSMLDDPLHYLDDLELNPDNGSNNVKGRIRGDKIGDIADDFLWERINISSAQSAFRKQLNSILSAYGYVGKKDYRIELRRKTIDSEELEGSGSKRETPRIIFRDIYDVIVSDKVIDMLARAAKDGGSAVIVNTNDVLPGNAVTVSYHNQTIQAVIDRNCRWERKELLDEAPLVMAVNPDLKARIQLIVNKLKGKPISENESPAREFPLSVAETSPYFKLWGKLAYLLEGVGPGGQHRLTKEDINLLRRFCDHRLMQLLNYSLVMERSASYGSMLLGAFFEYVVIVGLGLNTFLDRFDENTISRLGLQDIKAAKEAADSIQYIGAGGAIAANWLRNISTKTARMRVERFLDKALMDIAGAYKLELKLRDIPPIDLEMERIAAALGDSEQSLPPITEVMPVIVSVAIALAGINEPQNALAFLVMMGIGSQYLLYAALKKKGKLPENIVHFFASIAKGWPALFAIKGIGFMTQLDLIAGALVTNHMATAMEAVNENRKGVDMREKLHDILGNLSKTMMSEHQRTVHDIWILAGQDDPEEYWQWGKRKFGKMDEWLGYQGSRPGNWDTVYNPGEKQIVYDGYAIGFGDDKLVENGHLLLDSGGINIFISDRKPDRILTVGTLGEYFEHDSGSAFIREDIGDSDIHEKTEERLVYYKDCDYKSYDIDILADAHEEDIRKILLRWGHKLEELTFPSKSQYFDRRNQLALKYLEDTGMFLPGELADMDFHDEDKIFSPSVGRRINIAMAMLTRSKVVVLGEVFDLTDVSSDNLQKEREHIAKIILFLSRMAKDGQKIILIGGDYNDRGQSDEFRKAGVLGHMFTVKDKKFEEIT